MTKDEILEKALIKAEINGYTHNWIGEPDKVDVFRFNRGYFSHKFAKAFWINNCWLCDKKIEGHIEHDRNISWKYHLQQMVIEEDPIKYLEKFL